MTEVAPPETETETPGAPAEGPAAAPTAPRPRRLRLVAAGVAVVLLGGLGLRALAADGGSASIAYDGADVAFELPSVPGEKPSENWSYSLEDSVLEDVGAIGDTVYAAISEDGEFELVALEKGSGEERWRSDLDGEGSINLLSAAGLVISVPEVYEGEGNGVVEAFTRDGELRWSYEADAQLDGATRVGDSLLLATSDADGDDAAVTRLDARTGDELWSVDGDAMSVTGDRIAVQDGDDVVVYQLGSGDEVWSTEIDEEDGTLLAAFGSLVAVADGEDVIAYRLSDGEEAWTTDAGVEDLFMGGVLGDGRLVVNGSDGGAVLDSDGKILWDDSDGITGMRAVIGGDELLIDNTDEDVLVINGTTGRREARTGFEEMWYAAGNAVLASEGSKVTAHAIPTLKETWTIRTDDDVFAAVPTGDGLLVATMDDEAELVYFD
jgi:outer membrane protein assembly factor BamB